MCRTKMKYWDIIRLTVCVCAMLSLINLCNCAPQYYNNNIHENDYNNYYQNYHPAFRRARYLYGGLPQNQQIQQSQILDKYRKSYYNNELQNNNGATNRQTQETDNQRQSQADVDNAKFVGVNNQENDEEESERVFKHLKKKRLMRLLANRCLAFGRESTNENKNKTDELGRFLWDVNVYNVYPPPPIIPPGLNNGGLPAGCAGLLAGGIGGGGGIFGDPLAPVAPIAPISPLNNFLSLFAPGILQNALAANVPPPPPPPLLGDPLANGGNQLPINPGVAPGYAPLPVRRPNQIYYDSAGAAPITPAQLVGGVATTVNGIIQQLTGNVQPVYQQNYG